MEARERDEREFRGVEHQFQAHENNEDVPPQQHARETDGKQQSAHQ